MSFNRKLLAATAAVALALPAAVMAEEQTAQSEITGEIVGACTISATNIDFGQKSAAEVGNVFTQQSAITVNCSQNLPYKVYAEISPSVEMRAPAAQGGGTSTETKPVTQNSIALGEKGTVALFSDSNATAAFPHDVSSALVRNGTGSPETIDVYAKWTMPATISNGSFGRYKVSVANKIVF